MEKKVLKIGISGSYGGLNLGDEAILQTIIEGVRSRFLAEITVFSKNPADTLDRHNVDSAVPVREMSRGETKKEISKLDYFILGGGGILFDQEVEIYLREVSLAHELSIPVFVYGISAGPLEAATNRKAVARELNKVQIITVRDRQAKYLLEEIGVKKKIFVGADPALLLTPEHLTSKVLEEEGVNLSKSLVGISVREPGPAAPDIDVEHYHALLANVADFIVERLDANIVFVPMERSNKDIQQSHAVIAKMFHAQRAAVLKKNYSPSQMLGLVGNFEFAIGMRLHFLIFAALMGVPFVALPYAGKVSGFIEALGMRSPPLSEVTIGRLLAYVDVSWDNRAELKKHILSNLPDIQNQARQVNESFCEMVLKNEKNLKKSLKKKEEKHASIAETRY